MLTLDDVHAALHTKRITKRVHSLLVRAIESGVVDPVEARLSKGLVRTWFELVTPSRTVNPVVAQTRQRLEGKLSPNGASVHRTIVSTLYTLRFNGALGTYLEPWIAVTENHPTVLEAVTWIWLYAAGHAPEEPPIMDNHGTALSAETAKRDPAELIRVLSQFKRQYELRAVQPAHLVDTLALAHGWWSEGDETRSDALLYANVCESLSEHEWTAPPPCAEDSGDSLRRLVASRRLVDLGPDLDDGGGGVTRITLRSIYDTSARVKCIARTLAETLPRADAWTVPDETVRDLTGEQRALVHRVALQGHRLTLLCAPAGTGKTHTAVTLASLAPERVLCLAPTHKAIAVLRKKFEALTDARHSTVVMEFMTVHRFSLLTDEVHADLVVVDETSMITMTKIRSILERFYRRPNTRLLLMGDDAQLPCIGRGLPIRDLQECITTLRFTRCMRTDGQSLLALATAIRTGATDPPLDGVVDEAAADALVEAAVGAYPVAPVLPPWDPAYVQIISPQNKHVQELNAAIQNRIVRDPSKPSVTVSGCLVGDAVRVKRNTPVYKNGDEGILEDIVPAGVEDVALHGKGKRAASGDYVGIVRLQDDSRVRVWKYDMDPAYATTVHKVQGSEYPHVVLAMFPRTHPNLCTREILYTSVTRARDSLRIVGDSSLLRNMTTNARRTVLPAVANSDCAPEDASEA